MPHLGGDEVARAIRRDPWGAQALLVALTGWGQAADKARALDAGFDHHVPKPVEPGAIEALLGR